MLSKLQDYWSSFSGLTENQLVRLKQASQEKKYRKDELIFSQGEPATAVWLVKEGRVHLQNVSYDGKVITSCVMTKGDVFCCLPALDGKSYTADALVVEPAVVLKIPGDTFRELLHENDTFSKNILCSFCDRLRRIESRACQAYDPAELRIARLLLTLGEKFKNEIPLTRQEMAEVAGVTTETAIRVLSQMKKNGLIRSSRKLTRLINSAKLRELIGG